MAEPFIQETPPTPEQYVQEQANGGLAATREESTSASFQQAFESNPVSEISRLMNVSAADKEPNQRTLSIPELEKQYNGYGINWTEPKKENVARLMAQDRLHQMQLQQKITSGPQDFTQSALGFGASTVAGLLDPVTLASFAAGGELLEGAGLVAKGAGMGSATINAAASGAVGQIPLEGLKAIGEGQRGNDVTAGEAIGDLGQAALGGVAFHAIGAGIGKLWQSARMKLGGVEMPAVPEGHQSSIPTALDHPAVQESLKAQAIDGRVPNIEKFDELFHQERAGPWNEPQAQDNSGRSSHEFKPIDPDKPVSDKVFVGTDSHVEDPAHIDLKDYPNAMRENDFGHGTTAVFDPRAANGYSATSFNESPGVIHEFDLKDAKLLSTESDVPPDAKQAIQEFVTESKSEPWAKDLLKGLKDEPNMGLRDIYDHLKDAPHGVLDAANQALKEAGYDGVHFIQESLDGTEKHNGVTLFPGAEDKLSHIKAIQSDPSLLKGPSESAKAEMLASHTDPNSQLFNDPEEKQQLKQFEKLVRHADVPRPPTELETELNQVRDDLTKMSENSYMHPDVKADFEAIKTAFDKLANVGEKLRSMLFDCIGSG